MMMFCYFIKELKIDKKMEKYQIPDTFDYIKRRYILFCKYYGNIISRIF